jgi:hypothetical protein
MNKRGRVRLFNAWQLCRWSENGVSGNSPTASSLIRSLTTGFKLKADGYPSGVPPAL